MNLPILLSALCASAAVMFMRTYCVNVWKKIRPVFLVIMGILSVCLILFLLFAAWTMIGRPIFSAVEKTVYCIVIAILIVCCVLLNITAWKKDCENERK